VALSRKLSGQCNKSDFTRLPALPIVAKIPITREFHRDKNLRVHENEFVWMEQRDIRAGIRPTRNKEDRGKYHVPYMFQEF